MPANNVTIYLHGKRYIVPDNLTIMKAIEYCGYELVRGVGCRHGFCGACTTIYRLKGVNEIHYCLACETQVKDEMYIATLPFFPMAKQIYNMDEIKPEKMVMMQLYPEIYSCISCNTCTNTCTRGLDVMNYIIDAQNGDFAACAAKSFDCIMCGACSSRCPAGISHPEVAMLARRLNGKYIEKESGQLVKRVDDISRGKMLDDVKKYIDMSDEELSELYNSRVIEK